MRIAIFGSGGVGAYFGGRLAQAGEELVFIARGAHLQAMHDDGLRIDSIEGDFMLNPVQATDNPAAAGKMDLIIVCVKTWQLADAAAAMAPMIGPDTLVLPLLNGVEAPSQLAAALGEEHILGGLCGIMAYIAGPGHIRHAAISPFIKLGELDNRSSERVTAVRRVLAAADGLSADIPADIHVAMWQKFLFIIATSGIGAVTRAPFGIFRAQAETRELLTRAMEEVFAVAKARAIALPADIIEKTLATIDQLPEDGTASMQRDIMSGRRSELEQQNGAVVRLGREAGVPTPVNDFIYASLLPMELRARGELRFA